VKIRYASFCCVSTSDTSAFPIYGHAHSFILFSLRRSLATFALGYGNQIHHMSVRSPVIAMLVCVEIDVRLHELGFIQVIGSTRICNVPSTIDRLQRCVSSIRDWCTSRRLQLNPSKTELIWFGSCASLRKIADNGLSLRVGGDVIIPVDVVRDLGVTFDSQRAYSPRHVNYCIKRTHQCPGLETRGRFVYTCMIN